MEEIKIRTAEIKDVEQLQILNEQLGYTVSVEYLSNSLVELLQNKDYEILVAEQTVTGLLAGYLFAYIKRSIMEECTYEALGLIVREEYRGFNIGVKLLSELERIALSKNIHYIYLRSNVKRDKAHKFYLREGYSIVKSQHAFLKKIDI